MILRGAIWRVATGPWRIGRLATGQAAAEPGSAGPGLIDAVTRGPEVTLSVLRLGGLALRLGLSLFVLAALGVAAFGQLALIQALAILLPALSSLGLHHRVNRSVVDRPPDVMAACLRDRVAMNLLLGAAGVGLALPVLTLLPLPERTGMAVALVAAILLVEVVLADAQVFLIGCRRSVLAGVMLFLRGAGWVPAYVALAWSLEWEGLGPLLWFWLGGGLCAVAVMAAGLADWPWGRVLRQGPGLRWQVTGLRGALLLWVGDVAVAAAAFLERAVLLALLGPVAAGAYVFLWTLANGIQQVLMAAIVQPAMPDMVAAVRGPGGAVALRRLTLDRARRVLWAGAGTGAAVVGAAVLVLPMMDRPEVTAALAILPVLVAGLVAACLADLLRLALYARQKDAAIIGSNLVMVGLNTGLVAAMAGVAGLWGVAAVPLVVAAITAGLRWRAAFGRMAEG